MLSAYAKPISDSGLALQTYMVLCCFRASDAFFPTGYEISKIMWYAYSSSLVVDRSSNQSSSFLPDDNRVVGCEGVTVIAGKEGRSELVLKPVALSLRRLSSFRELHGHR
jgi:hypothetical protein